MKSDRRKTLLFLTDKAKVLKSDDDSGSDEKENVYYRGLRMKRSFGLRSILMDYIADKHSGLDKGSGICVLFQNNKPRSLFWQSRD